VQANHADILRHPPRTRGRGARRVHQVAPGRSDRKRRHVAFARHHANPRERRWAVEHRNTHAAKASVTTAAVDIPAPLGEGRESYLTIARTVQSWLVTTDHKRIGILYLFSVLFFLALGGTFALLIRIEHFTPGPTIMDAMSYDRLFTLHGVTMVWLFMIPSIPAAFGNFFLPLQIGAKDVAFPRLNLISYYIYVIGASVIVVAMFAGGVDTGWTFYSPY